MIQRMGRILRRKEIGSGARFVILFSRDTLEDPTAQERDGFMEEIENISETSKIFDVDEYDKLATFLEYAGPEILPDIRKIGPMSDLDQIPDGIDPVEEYAWLSYLSWAQTTERHEEVWENPPVTTITPPYLEFDTPLLPEITKEKKTRAKSERLSTGENPVKLFETDGGYILQCTGCGALSELTPFRWKALESVVECSCLW